MTPQLAAEAARPALWGRAEVEDEWVREEIVLAQEDAAWSR